MIKYKVYWHCNGMTELTDQDVKDAEEAKKLIEKSDVGELVSDVSKPSVDDVIRSTPDNSKVKGD